MACTRVPRGKRRTTACADECAGARELLAPRVTHLAHIVRSDDAIGEGGDGGDQREDDEDGVSGVELGADAEGFVEDDIDARKNAECNAKIPSEEACTPVTSSREWQCARVLACCVCAHAQACVSVRTRLRCRDLQAECQA